MFRTVLLGAMLLGAAAGGPYLFSNAPDLLGQFSGSPDEDAPNAATTEKPGAASAGESDPLAAIPTGKLPELEGQPVADLAEVLRFDISPGWVLARWPHVTTGMAHVQYQGYRVPLVTGTKADDLAGSLTYYFGAKQQVERIVFRGTTGDVRKLVALVMNRYGFVRRLTNDPGLFLYEAAGDDGRVHSMLNVRAAPVIKADDQHHRYQVDLTISRPAS
jgi:hypothetical protein